MSPPTVWARRCGAVSPPLPSERVTAYHQRHGGGAAAMAVLVQAMVDPIAAGVAFTAHPVTGDRDQTVVTAVPGLGEPLVSGEAVGEEWTVTARSAPDDPARRPPASAVLTAEQAQAVADLARTVADRLRPAARHRVGDRPRRHAVAAAGPADDRAAGTGVMDGAGAGAVDAELPARRVAARGRSPRCSRTWLLPVLEDGYLDGMHASVGVRVPFRYAAGQRLVLQRHPDPVTETAGPGAAGRDAAGR